MRNRISAIAFYGSFACNIALLALSKARTGRSGPGVNCTAHWLKGHKAAKIQGFDLVYTGTGVGTNCAAVVFWAALYDRALGKAPGLLRAILVTLALGPVAALVDYKATPKRFTPGWELIFSRKDMVLIYAAMVAGMAAGAVRGIRCSRD